jgi:hypothetical protein
MLLLPNVLAELPPAYQQYAAKTDFAKLFWPSSCCSSRLPVLSCDSICN